MNHRTIPIDADELAKLRESHAELLAALQACKAYDDEGTLPDKRLRDQVEAAIANVTGEP